MKRILLVIILIFFVGCNGIIVGDVVVTEIRLADPGDRYYEEYKYIATLQRTTFSGEIYLHTNHLYNVGDTLR